MKTPPKFITTLVERLTDHRESEVILGDMYEEYETRLKTSGKFRADAGYVIDFLSLAIHRVLRNKKRSSRSNFFTMLTNYFKVAFRQLGRQRLHNFINISGLAVGLAVSFVISLYVLQELSFDKFHTKRDRLYLLPMTWKFSTTQLAIAGTTSAAGPVMKELFSKEIETYVRLQDDVMIFERPQGPIEEKWITAADSTFFDVFTFPLISGNPKQALTEPYSLVLTEKAAAKYFGEDWVNKDVMSQTLTEQSGRVYKITGIMKDPPAESHIRFEVLMSMSSLPKKETDPNWDRSSMVTYVLLEDHASPAAIVAGISKRIAERYGAQQNDYVELDLVPIRDVYLNNQKYIGIRGASDIRYVYVFSAIAALVLLIAIINYMNLSTARSMERAREVGVRKVVGALRLELFWQFISESVLVSLVAVTTAIIIAYLLLPLFNNIAGKALSIDFSQHPEWIAALVGIWLVISFLGGAYPAAVLSSFRPVKVLKGKLGTLGSGAVLRKSLVVFQFGVSIFLIVCTLTINNQLTFMVNSKIGVDKEKLVSMQLDSMGQANLSIIRNEFSGIIGVEQIMSVSSTPVNIGARSTIVGGDVGDKQIMIYNIGVSPEFVKTTGLEIVAGEDLSGEIPKDGTWEFLLNESAVTFLGWTNESAVGKRMSMWQVEGIVKGVVRDFHFLPLRKPIDPLIAHAGKSNEGYINKLIVRIQGDNVEGITTAMEERWKKVIPGSPFSFSFVDDHYHNLYNSETRLSSIMNVFSVLAILIAGLGLFGLASYTIMQRTKELGIRKVLGATFSGLVMVVSTGFIRLVVLAFVIAAPVSWYVMSTWLENFAYPIGFNWAILIGSGFVAIVVALGTVLYHALEAVRVNPVNSLRSE